MSKKYYIYSTAAGCTSNLWESAVYDDYFKSEDMTRVFKADDADVIVVNTCSVTPGFEDQSERYIEKMMKTQMNGAADDKKLIIAGCYSAIRAEKIDDSYANQNKNITHMKPVEMEKLSTSLGLDHEKTYKPITTNRFDDITNCHSSIAHKIVWGIRKAVRFIYGLLGITDSYLLNFLDTMIFSDGFYVIEVGHGCAGGCTFCSIKQSRGFVHSQEELTVLDTLNKGLEQGYKNFWLLATDIGAWGLDRNKNPADLMAPLYERKEDFRVVLNYLEPRWLLYHENIHKYLKDHKTIGVTVPIQSGSTRLVYHSGRRYDPVAVADCVSSIKEKNPNLIVKTDIMVGLPSETWTDFYQSLKAVFRFDVIVPIVFGVRPGTKAERDPEMISTPIKFFRMGVITIVALSWQIFLCVRGFVKDIFGIFKFKKETKVAQS
ncbi:radical SAM protein [Halobacteriovorax sp. HLS]|uniref:radical SAM protein n=1 Tax=Halobacteriovorax sp. HLS TaxID=2234000 RepID=UPI000FD76727|nr:radical SAM protein [Halobacteriovorax sp. HLS]